MKTLTIKTIKPIELTDDEVSVHLQTHESELNLLTDRINTLLDMVENLQDEVKALEDELSDPRFNERVYDHVKEMVADHNLKLMIDFYVE